MSLSLTVFGHMEPVAHGRRRRVCSLGQYRPQVFYCFLPLPLVGSNLEFVLLHIPPPSACPGCRDFASDARHEGLWEGGSPILGSAGCLSLPQWSGRPYVRWA